MGASAVLVAGGRSTRFGDREKALVPVDGTPMLARVADRVAPLVDDLVVNCRRDQRDAFADALAAHEPRFAVDPVPDRGPVAGLRTGLRVAGGHRVVALACDLPFIEPALPEYLLYRCRRTDAAAVVPRADGRWQPLCAAYDVSAAHAACSRVLARGDRGMHALLVELDSVATIGESAIDLRGGTRALANVNAPADLRDATETPP